MITTNLNSKLKRNISFHSSIFIGKNAIVFWMADLWQFKKYDKIAFYTTKNILIIFIVNLFLHVGYTWTLLNMDIKSYEQLAITSQCFFDAGDFRRTAVHGNVFSQRFACKLRAGGGFEYFGVL